jgi:hypothetical protein
MKQLAGGKIYGKRLFSEDLEVRDESPDFAQSALLSRGVVLR